MISFHENTQRILTVNPGTFVGRFPGNRPSCRRDDGDKVCKYVLIRVIYWLWRRLSEPLSPVWCGTFWCPGYVTWELILDGYSKAHILPHPICSRQAAVVLLQGERCCKIHSRRNGNRETRSGEFCRGMTLFMSYFFT